ncbi:hypothetical protein GCM10011529_22040 [Polymorphobacter glacialis]|uniref:TonB-dependent receptor n=1 Tax=Sandarakinorhabdus glacialis TaxID=1614636 RepID=A0A917E916_9SPHN|nr:TonB-dependent receptor [Polymorphobacter glacialis]GGE15220.1 hypothetical protein GCM10011529_22040 [Polymorphobacter glacialis]
MKTATTRGRLRVRAVLLAASALAVSSVASAQEVAPAGEAAATTEAPAVAPSGLPEVVVTAQRRRESAQSVPIAVSVFSADDLDAKNIQATSQLGQYVPNMVGTNVAGLGSANAYFIRGLGNTETIATFDPVVGTYIDEIALGRQSANNFNFFDVERVEVLRGPQGVLMGRNPVGGAVSVVLKRPGTELAGYGEFTYGSYDRKLARASLDMPLAAGVGLKLSGYFQDDDGYAANTTTGEQQNDNDGAGFRLALRLDFAENFDWNGSFAYVRADSENLLNYRCDPRSPNDCDGRFATTGLRQATSSYAPLEISGAKREFGLGNRTDTLLYTSNFEWSSDAATLNVITGFVDLTQRYAIDFADGRALPNLAAADPVVRGFPLGGYTVLNDSKHSQFSQEVKLSGRLFGGLLDYVTGVYLLDENNDTDFADIQSIYTGTATPMLLADRRLNNSVSSWAGYFQGDLNLFDGLKLTAGVRYTDEERRFTIVDNRPQCAGSTAVTCLNFGSLVAPNGVPIPVMQKTQQWAPRFAVNYKPNDDLLLFASATRGFGSGGWNARGYNADELLPFGPQAVWSYEAGIKSEWFGNRLRANVTAFLLDAKNLQTPSTFVRRDNSTALVTQNFADYRNKGVEIELTAVPVDGLNLYLNLGLQDDAYRIDSSAPNFDEYGVASTAFQQARCAAQLASGQVPLSPNSAPAGMAANNAPACAAGIVTAAGTIARPVRTPSVSVSAGASYDFRLPLAGIILTPTVNATWRSSYETGSANASIYSGPITAGPGGGGRTFAANPNGGTLITGSQGDSFALVNAGLAMRTDDNNWTLALECTNCLDTTYVESTLGNATYLNTPRVFQVRLKRVL